MIPLREQELLRQQFQRDIQGPVKIDLFTRRPSPVFVPGREECEFCPPTEQLLEEVAALSHEIDLRVHEFGSDTALEQRYGVERIPATVVRGVVNRPVLFTGIPTGSLFLVLINGIIHVSGPAPDMPPTVRRRLKRLKRPVKVQVFGVPNDEHSGHQAELLQVLALCSRHIQLEIIEAAEFATLAQGLGVTETPTTVLDGGKSVLTGCSNPEELIDQLVSASEHQTVAARGSLILGGQSGTTTPLPRSTAESVTTRPSGLIIPGR